MIGEQNNQTETIEELEIQVAKEQAILAEYERMESLEENPRRRLRLQENIEDSKNLLLTLQTRTAQLREKQQPAPRRPIITDEPLFVANVPYGLDAKIVGREQEMLLLDDWFHRDPEHPFLAVIGLGGTGKSALTWAWMQKLRVDGLAPRLVVWWSFYEAEGTMQALLAAMLTVFGDDPARFPNLRAAVNQCTYYLQRVPTLLMLDGAERLLRAYGNMAAAYQADNLESGLDFQQARQCIDPAAGELLRWLAQPNLTHAQTLMTSRLLPRELTGRTGLLLAGVRRHDLTGLTPDAAVELFRQAGVKATRAEVIDAAEPLGYHPLSLRILAGHAADNPGDHSILKAAAEFDPDTELFTKRTHILKRAYDGLPPTAQHTLSRLAAFRSGVDWPTIEAIFIDDYKSTKRKKRSLFSRLFQSQSNNNKLGNRVTIEANLKLLENRGLLQKTIQSTNKPNQPNQPNYQLPITNYQLHPIVRRYAYDRLADPAAIHSQLAGYFEAVPKPEKVNALADLALTIELYHHLVQAEQYDEAWLLYRDRLWTPIYYQLGQYHTQIELLKTLFVEGEDKLPSLSEESYQAHICNELANSYSLAGRPNSAVPITELACNLAEKQGNKKNLAIGLGNLADVQMKIGAPATAETNLRRRIALCREIEDRFGEAVGHQELGRLLAYCGRWEEAAAELDTALEQFTDENEIQSQCIVWAYRALAALLQGDGRTAVQSASEALRLAEMHGLGYPVERDYVRAYWLLGWAALANGDLPAAGQHLDESLRRCRAINNVEHEPAILLSEAWLARARVVTDNPVGAGLAPALEGEPESGRSQVGRPEEGQPQPGRPQGSPLREARDYAEEALLISERAGYVLDLADIHNFLAQLALDAGDRDAARDHATQTRDYAFCDGPPHTYKVALEEAERLLGIVG